MMITSVCCVHAQFNVEKVLSSAEIALHYQDYPLSIAYDNQILALRPYLYKPWQLRSAAKFYLEDYKGCEEDASEALQLNPYLEELYDLRAISRIYQNNWQGAVDDYTKGLEINPKSKEFWYNRALCEFYRKNFDVASEQIDTINRRWSGFVNAYSLKAELLLQQKDTVSALACIDKGLELNPYDYGIWYSKAMVFMSKHDWKEAGLCLSKVCRMKSKHVTALVNLAFCYAQLGETNSAKSKYTLALEFDPSNITARYNRGLINACQGRYEEALMDFNHVLALEPGNSLAQKNKELLLLRGNNAQRKEMWSIERLKELRHPDDMDLTKFASLVNESDEEHSFNLEFLTEFQAKRQGGAQMDESKSMFLISYVPYSNGSQSYLAFDRDVEKFIAQGDLLHGMYVTCGQHNVNPTVMRETFEVIDTLTKKIDAFFEGDDLERLYMQRAVAYSVVQNYPDAIADLNNVITLNPESTIAYWQRAVCQTLLNGFNIAHAMDVRSKSVSAMADIDKALELAPKNAYLYYNKAIIYSQNQEVGPAIEDYSNAILIEPNMAEAYYNRGLLYLKQENHRSAVADLKKAGELGVKDAYSILNRIGVVK